LALPAVRARIAALGFEAVGNEPAEFGRFIAAEAAKWRDVIQTAGIRVE
jgi:tripartite-type tricarboxylate transporter receptor subunit TctC